MVLKSTFEPTRYMDANCKTIMAQRSFEINYGANLEPEEGMRGRGVKQRDIGEGCPSSAVSEIGRHFFT
ncbi:hypothetical protein CARUB_v10027745mg [Capsella rubella]|uniref:Uncharacterized protein n=1 Tax=Capsella rubella TaxID=81985 RepID=R0EZ25_9BRAS|nr:hypothetical protein CARUB_v10027745mg [Capsella rubella]